MGKKRGSGAELDIKMGYYDHIKKHGQCLYYNIDQIGQQMCAWCLVILWKIIREMMQTVQEYF